MGKLLKTLAKMGLVELDADNRAILDKDNQRIDMTAIDHILQEQALSQGATPAVPKAPQPSSDVAQKGDAGILEGRSFEEIYALARVPPSAYPAEKLLKLLDGLRTMDPGTRKAAVMAMDAADEDWTVENAIRDAQHKIRALQDASASLVEAVSRAEAKAQADLDAQERYQQEAMASIRKQIAELEALLEQELQKVAEERAAIQAQLQQTREACERETSRFKQEITRLKEIPDSFGGTAPTQSN
jgi:hypothetical protein